MSKHHGSYGKRGYQLQPDPSDRHMLTSKQMAIQAALLDPTVRTLRDLRRVLGRDLADWAERWWGVRQGLAALHWISPQTGMARSTPIVPSAVVQSRSALFERYAAQPEAASPTPVRASPKPGRKGGCAQK